MSRENIITVRVQWYEPETAAKLASLLLETMQDHMTDEKQRIAAANTAYLREQLEKAVDPVTRQKIYFLLSKQLETKILSEVKENASFKIIDPPMAPDKKIAPARTKMVLFGLVLSSCLGILLAIYWENYKKRKLSLPQ